MGYLKQNFKEWSTEAQQVSEHRQMSEFRKMIPEQSVRFNKARERNRKDTHPGKYNE